ncbi:MAG: DUF4065 domain-containing protein [Bacteroidaceae bacterium]|nr:DUF4065 domain-containing protein [Bacteroidaceae bacterium]
MTSPYTGKEMKLVYEPRTWNFRGEDYEYIHTAYLCEDTGEQFTTCESDDAGFLQVTNQYRAKYGIPYTDEIIAVRNRYGVSAAKMSAILGIGTNQWRLYESGEVPSVSNGRMIRSIMNPKVFLDLVESARQMLTEKEYENISEKVKKVIEQSGAYHSEEYECRRVFASSRGAANGFSATSLPKLKTVMLAVLQECGEVFYTKMNKLLFYVDFFSYRQRGMSMTGLSYLAIDFGPVPERWDKVYSEFDEIHQELCPVGDCEGNMLVANGVADETLLSDIERSIIHTVCERFKSCSSREISTISHDEPAWQKYHETHSRIPFVEAFSLKAI